MWIGNLPEGIYQIAVLAVDQEGRRSNQTQPVTAIVRGES